MVIYQEIRKNIQNLIVSPLGKNKYSVLANVLFAKKSD